MIISKSNEAFELADGARPHMDDPRRLASGGGGGQFVEASGAGAGAAGQRWEDDGGPLHVLPPIRLVSYSTMPTWSVLSLRDLNLAIRLGHWPDNPAPLQRAAAEARRGRAAGEARGRGRGGRKEST